ncbi:cyclin-T2-like [Denticeps clupeoides]|uniref:Cyclin-like domain-containing protein n=1 Tax=Denticeps clupeoides TaxID=299321 RepID=A0AAY4B7A7_9TELE|nr:cyclin-T2-like [Denticeps clupeoides]
MAAYRGPSSKWFFTREQLESTPSRRSGVEPDRELSYRQQAANLIQDMGQRLNVSQLTINTAIVYMHRFYMYHSFTKFHRNIISPTTLFLAAKVEEQPRKLEHVIKVAHACLNPQEPPLDTKSNAYLQQAQELVILETIVLQTLGFEITIEHPHTDVVKCSQLVRASKDLAQTSYFMATNSLHLTTFCLQYKPTVIACVCIHLACKWSKWEIPVSTDGKHWWEYVDNCVTLELLDELTHEFLQILEKTPSRLKRIRNWRATQAAKKPKGEGQVAEGGTLAGPSLAQDHPLVVDGPGAASLASNSGAPVCLDTLASMQGGSYSFGGPSSWPGEQSYPEMYTLKQDLLTVSQSRSSKGADFQTVKQEHKAADGGAKTQPPAFLPPGATQKLSLDQYRELAGQKRRQEQVGVEGRDPADHRKHEQLQGHPQSFSHDPAACGSGATAASPVRMKPVAGHNKPSAKDKSITALKLRLPLPSQGEKSAGRREELKMKIRVASERHSSSDEGGAKSKHSSPLVKEKSQRHHHHKHSHTSKPGPEGLGVGVDAGGGSGGLTPGASSSRKRTHVDAAHNHHSKKSKCPVGVPDGLPTETGHGGGDLRA